MRYFKVLNLNRQSNGPVVVTEKGFKEMQNSKSLKTSYQLIGECDGQGNLIAEISSNNFMSAPKPTQAKQPIKKTEVKKQTDDVPDMDSDVREFHKFSDKEIKILQNEQKEKGTGRGKSGKPTSSKAGKK